MHTVDFHSVEAALSCLNICYRKLPWKNGALYFCTSLATELTFDLSYGEDGMVRLWRFIGMTSAARAGIRYEYCEPEAPYAAAGIEITDDGDIRFYVTCMVDGGDSKQEDRIHKIISGYVNFVAKSPLLSSCL